MEPRITREALESYLACKLKGHLKLKGEQGTNCDYEMLMREVRVGHAQKASKRLEAGQREGEVQRNLEVTPTVLKKGSQLILDGTVNGDTFSIRLDGLKRVEGLSRLGSFHFVPILFVAEEKLRPEQRRLLEVCGLILGDIQGKQPAYGIVIRGKQLTSSKVHFKEDTRFAKRVPEEVKKVLGASSPPPLILNDHCQVCEFRQKCQLQAVNEDNLSLLRGVGAKEMKSFARKGIFTITQLAHTFRPRRKGKRAESRSHHRYHALNALAIRNKFIYIFGTPQIPTSTVNVFVDIEGKPDQGFVYLVGMVIIRDGVEERRSFWADTQEEEYKIFEQFLDEMEKLNSFVLFTYGGYERAFFKRMKNKTDRHDLVDRVLGAHVNILSLIYSNFYFPTNGTDHRNGVIFDQQNGSAPGGWTGHDAIGAYAGVARHVAKSAESNRTRNLAWQSWARTGRPGVRAC